MSANNTSNVNTPTTGIISDEGLIQLDSKYYAYALNAMIADRSGEEPSLQNEMSNLCAVTFPVNYRVVGVREIPEQNRTIYMLVNTLTGMCQIGEVHNCYPIKNRTDRIEDVFCEDCGDVNSPELPPLEQQKEKCYCTYRLITQSNCLGFDINYPIDIEYRITSCGLNIYFTDAKNERRFAYFDYVGGNSTGDLILQNDFKVAIPSFNDPCIPFEYLDEIDCNKIKIHPHYDRVCTEFLDFVNGGNLKAGVYQILIGYSDAYGNVMTQYAPASQIIPLFKKQITFETNYSTSSALHFKLLNLLTDIPYKYYNIVIAETIDNFTQFKYIGTFPTTQTEYIYTGFENTIKVLASTDIIFKYPYYKTAEAVTKANNYLIYSGVKSYKKLNLQPVANAIRLYWQTAAIKEGSYKDPRYTNLFRSEQRDEVVPYGIVFEFTNGEETCAFHIPGRAAEPSDLISILSSNVDFIPDSTCNPVSSRPTWQIYNTATVEGTPHEYNADCEVNKCWEWGTFSYWESTETYPTIPEVWGSLCGQPIRHHKYPDSCISHIHDGLNGTKTYSDTNYIFPIGIRIDHNSVINAIASAVTAGVITQEDADRIKSYRIVRGNRLGQKSIIAKGLFFNMWSYDRFSKTYYYPNYAYNDLTDDYFLCPYDGNTVGTSNTSDPVPTPSSKVENKRFTFHSPDTHFVNPELGSYIKLETEEYGQSEGYFTHSDCQSKYKLLSTAVRVLAFGLGMAAALSATGHKVCRAVTVKSERHIEGYVNGTTPGATVTVPVPIPNAVQGDLATSIGALDSFSYDPTTGLPIIPNPLAAETTFNTCKGQTYQIVNANIAINAIFIGLLGVPGLAIQQFILGIQEMDKVLQTMLALIPYKNYSIQYNSIGRYNNYKCVGANNKNREILRSAYLEPMIQSVDEISTIPGSSSTTVFINNWHRESSVYLNLSGTALVNPSITDNSRVTMDNQFGYKSAHERYESLDEIFNRTISSYYGSIKRIIPNQYGNICSIDYLDIDNCSFYLNNTYTECETRAFGGDTFINRFSLKRKMPFYTQTRCGLPNGADIKYSSLPNVAFPNYYLNTEEPFIEKLSDISGLLDILSLSGVQDVLGTADTRLDARTAKFFYQNGYLHLYNYGVPSFIVESDINLDYRHGENDKEKDFYPHQKDLKYWFEEAIVPIKEDNYYFYNRTYSKQNHESAICTSCIRTIQDLTCNTHDDNLVIYSEQNEQERKSDNWLVFKANNFYNFPLADGKIISIDGIENDKVLVRLENSTQLFNAYNTLQATPENIQVGTGGLFATRPVIYASTDLGYAGTQHRDILHTEFGHVWGDAKRGTIFNLANGGGQLDEISKNGVRHWFKENLPFQLLKDFPEISSADLDNNLKGIGLHYCFDKRFNRILVTKLDYKVLDKNVKYNTTTHKFYILVDSAQVEVSVNNPKYFCNKSWTRSYNFITKGWTSFHSYIPNFYTEHVDTFESSEIVPTIVSGQIGYKQKTYTHNASNKSYQVFYGKLYPFIVEVFAKQSIENNFIDSISYSLDVIRYHNEFDAVYNNDKGFNKAIIYNERQCSGLLHLIRNDHDDLSMIGDYPKRVENGYEILTTNSENIWNFNDFFDAVRNTNNNVPFFIFDCANSNKILIEKALDYDKDDFDRARIRARMSKVRFINDKHSNYKMIYNFGVINQTKSYR